MFSQLLLLILHAQPFLIFGCHAMCVTFVMVINFINSSWEPTHVTVGVFEMKNTTSATMAN
jgi:hypothetical protein